MTMPMARRIEDGVQRPDPVTITVDDAAILAYPGESVVAALLAAGATALRRTPSGQPRGPFCNMGACFECLVTIDGAPSVRACSTPVREGMTITTAARTDGSD